MAVRMIVSMVVRVLMIVRVRMVMRMALDRHVAACAAAGGTHCCSFV
jgi:hypothetical protein